MARNVAFLAGTALVLLVCILMAGCTGTPSAPSGEIKKFSSAEEIQQFIQENTAKAGQAGYGVKNGAVRSVEEGDVAAVPAAQGALKSSPAITGMGEITSPGTTTDYSTTTVQVAGVDEPDFVKNDGRYIYVIAGDRLLIVDAYPAKDARIVSETEIEDTVREIFLSGDRLVIFSTGSSEVTGPAGGSTGEGRIVGVATGGASAGAGVTSAGVAAPVPVAVEKAAVMPAYYRTHTTTTATVYDISDRKNPAVLTDFTIDGDYVDARMIDGVVYLLTREDLYTYDDIVVPVVRTSGSVVAEPGVYYFDNPETQYVFSTVTSFDAGTGSEKDAKTFLLGSGNILYVSKDAMYISYQRWHPVYGATAGGPGIGVSALTAADDSSGSSAPSGMTYEEFNRLSEPEKQAAIAKLKEGTGEPVQNQEVDQTTTVIHKIAIGGGNIAYVARGEVAGYLKNQFSMDEYGGNLRLATTSDSWTRSGQYEYNNVFVLDSRMKTTGSLTHIAGQEKIYATRFIGDRLYMVTYKRIDPFFTIDLSDPANPRILGKLKIPGYSDYLYPYDKNTIIGVGKETATNDWGGVSTRGVKLALFDVTDVEHPRQIDKVEIGYAGTDSAALYDHKAFLFSKEKNLLVLPIRQVTTAGTAGQLPVYDSGQQVWYGAYVFGVSPDTGFTLRGTVKQGNSTGSYSWYGSSMDEVKRSLYIQDDLYTVSSSKIVASDLSDVNTTVATVALSKGPDYPDVPPRVY